jgi:hypothetical protein
MTEAQPLFTTIGAITVRSATKFVANERFVDNNFKAWFHGKIEEQAESEVTLLYHEINRGYYSIDGHHVIDQLGGEAKAEITLAEIAVCMEKQADGAPGALAIDGYVNTFFVRDVNRVLRAVKVRRYEEDWWGTSNGSWGMYALSIEDHRLDHSARFFSRGP